MKTLIELKNLKKRQRQIVTTMRNALSTLGDPHQAGDRQAAIASMGRSLDVLRGAAKAASDVDSYWQSVRSSDRSEALQIIASSKELAAMAQDVANLANTPQGHALAKIHLSRMNP